MLTYWCQCINKGRTAGEEGFEQAVIRLTIELGDKVLELYWMDWGRHRIDQFGIGQGKSWGMGWQIRKMLEVIWREEEGNLGT